MTGAAVLAAGRKIGPKDGAETMANFTYRALDQEGKIRKGMIDAPSRAQAIARIHDKKLMPIEVTASANGASARASRPDTQAATTTGKPVPFCMDRCHPEIFSGQWSRVQTLSCQRVGQGAQI